MAADSHISLCLDCLFSACLFPDLFADLIDVADVADLDVGQCTAWG